MYFYLAMVGYIYMVGLNHQQCKTIFTERFRLSPSSEFTGIISIILNPFVGSSATGKIFV